MDIIAVMVPMFPLIIVQEETVTTIITGLFRGMLILIQESPVLKVAGKWEMIAGLRDEYSENHIVISYRMFGCP